MFAWIREHRHFEQNSKLVCYMFPCFKPLLWHFLLPDQDICSLPSMQRTLHQLSGHGVPDRPSGCCQGHIWDTGCHLPSCCHRGALQGVFTRHHADRQPEEVSLDSTCLSTVKQCLKNDSRSTLHDMRRFSCRQRVVWTRKIHNFVFSCQQEPLHTFRGNTYLLTQD